RQPPELCSPIVDELLGLHFRPDLPSEFCAVLFQRGTSFLQRFILFHKGRVSILHRKGLCPPGGTHWIPACEILRGITPTRHRCARRNGNVLSPLANSKTSVRLQAIHRESP